MLSEIHLPASQVDPLHHQDLDQTRVSHHTYSGDLSLQCHTNSRPCSGRLAWAALYMFLLMQFTKQLLHGTGLCQPETGI